MLSRLAQIVLLDDDDEDYNANLHNQGGRMRRNDSHSFIHLHIK